LSADGHPSRLKVKKLWHQILAVFDVGVCSFVAMDSHLYVVTKTEVESAMQRILKTPLVVILVVILLGGVGVWRWHGRNHSQLSFRTAVVKRGDVTATISASGTIEPEEVVDVGAQVSARTLSTSRAVYWCCLRL